ncbi:polysaccharide deacetylase family protein [Salegentibacter maritimus]|uniref:polysaccharide deacetylase family protein n=1 Tax=Salegentibacter maritimus TaxID=2794347 RepID=UPI0018E4AB04|nr:polysaccharide deacetylase family protein [Salegentibacter maritimus]MBI6116593.1 polysaccharide deacetylase family protein [Salegentibacter maritimus]
MRNNIKNFYASIISRLLILFGLSKRLKNKALRGEFIISIYFHAPDASLFEFCIKWLKKNKFIFLSEKDIVAIANNKKPFPKSAVVITVDDGWLSNEKNVIEIAQKHQVPITIFVATDAIENGNYWWPYITKAQDLGMDFPSVKKLKQVSNKERERLVAKVKKKISLERQALDLSQLKKASYSRYINIGAHTVHHPILINCEDGESFREIKNSKFQIEKWLNRQVFSFAYPNGDYSEREINYLKKLNFSSAYTTKPDYLTKEKLQKIYELPRFCIYEGISEAEAICRMMGIWQRFFKD